jgi:hypothetical protein
MNIGREAAAMTSATGRERRGVRADRLRREAGAGEGTVMGSSSCNWMITSAEINVVIE